MPNPFPRIPISRNPAEILELAASVNKKHTELGAASPLTSMEDFNWRDVGPKLVEASATQERIDKLEKQLEELYGERDRHLPAIKGALASSRNVLKGIYAGNLKKLGEWGFTVDHTPKAPKKKKDTLG